MYNEEDVSGASAVPSCDEESVCATGDVDVVAVVDVAEDADCTALSYAK